MTHRHVYFKRRVLVSNEYFNAWPAGLPRKLGGMCAGVGATHLWTLAVHAECDSVLGCDRSESVRMQNELFIRLVRTSTDRHICLARLLSRRDGRFDKTLLRDTASALATSEHERIAFTELLWRHGFFGEALTYTGPTLGEHLQSEWHPLSSDRAYAHMQRLQTRFVAADVRTLELAALRLFYFSNVGDYVRPAPELAQRLRPLSAWAVIADGFTPVAMAWPAFCGWLAGTPPVVVNPQRPWSLFDASTLLPEEMRAELLIAAFEASPALATPAHMQAARQLSPTQQLRIAALRQSVGMTAPVPVDADAASPDWLPLLAHAPAHVIQAHAASADVTKRQAAAAITPLPTDPDEGVRSVSAQTLLARGEAFSDWSRVRLDGAALAQTPARENEALLRHLMEREGIDPVYTWPDWLLEWARWLPGLSPAVDEFLTPMTQAERAERLLQLTDHDRAIACANALALSLGFYQ